MPSEDDPEVDIDRYFSQTEKTLEVDRVLACFKLDPFTILEMPYAKPTLKSIKQAYRKKSLMIHPDKIKHEKAQEAFALLKKAESYLTDDKKLNFLMTMLDEAKYDVISDAGHKIKTTVIQVEDESSEEGVKSMTVLDEEAYPFLKGPDGQLQIREKFKNLLLEDEIRKRRLLKKEQEAEADKSQEMDRIKKERKRKAEEARQWEATRDTRVNSWRDFQKKGTKKAKVKKSGL